MATRLTYGTIILDSSEIIDFRLDREFKISSLSTIGLLEITQPSNLTPLIFDVSASIRDNADIKMNAWLDLINQKPKLSLNFLSKNWGDFYLNKLSISSNEMDNTGKILRFDLKVILINNQNFS